MTDCLQITKISLLNKVYQKELVICGSGIKYSSHMTAEAEAAIQSADCLCYLVNEPLMIERMASLKKNAIDMTELYGSYELRREAYHAVADFVVGKVHDYESVCMVLYGHPTICALPGVLAAKAAREKGIKVSILPGISSDACLYADLGINPLTHGLQSYEASYFVNKKPVFDIRSNLVLWQINCINVAKIGSAVCASGLRLLSDHLLGHYASETVVYLYEASLYPHIDPVIYKTELAKLVNADVSTITTLVIPSNECEMML